MKSLTRRARGLHCNCTELGWAGGNGGQRAEGSLHWQGHPCYLIRLVCRTSLLVAVVVARTFAWDGCVCWYFVRVSVVCGVLAKRMGDPANWRRQLQQQEALVIEPTDVTHCSCWGMCIIIS